MEVLKVAIMGHRLIFFTDKGLICSADVDSEYLRKRSMGRVWFEIESWCATATVSYSGRHSCLVLNNRGGDIVLDLDLNGPG